MRGENKKIAELKLLKLIVKKALQKTQGDTH